MKSFEFWNLWCTIRLICQLWLKQDISIWIWIRYNCISLLSSLFIHMYLSLLFIFSYIARQWKMWVSHLYNPSWCIWFSLLTISWLHDLLFYRKFTMTWSSIISTHSNIILVSVHDVYHMCSSFSVSLLCVLFIF